ncbi:hypothetical protein C6500_01890 [Candidatus Poribacteria bacterium]|nr:MAG: hypothetical protein C6500_01890 [Candidatus Poribacteria bacterium]
MAIPEAIGIPAYIDPKKLVPTCYCLYGAGEISESDPLPQRLLGKLPKYVDFYTAAYKTKVQQRRTAFVAMGILTWNIQ